MTRIDLIRPRTSSRKYEKDKETERNFIGFLKYSRTMSLLLALVVIVISNWDARRLSPNRKVNLDDVTSTYNRLQVESYLAHGDVAITLVYNMGFHGMCYHFETSSINPYRGGGGGGRGTRSYIVSQ